jgi:hypothetical protein
MDKYQEALKDFGSVMHLTYFEPTEHTRICDLCYLCLHELDLHAEGEYWHPIKERKALLKFCQKWGKYADEAGLDYVAESQQQFDAGRNAKKSDCLSV